jgi:hypothetical protein
MALDNLTDIREYRDKVEALAQDGNVVIGIAPSTLYTLLQVLFAEINRLSEEQVNPSRATRMESVTEIVSLNQRRKVRLERDYQTSAGTEGPDLVPLD